jgi:hypothetical protein
MVRTLVIILVASFVLAVACFSGAVAVGGRDLMEHGWTISPAFLAQFEDDDDDDVSITVGQRHAAGPDVTRDLAWTGGDSLRIDLPAEVEFTQGETAKITVSGPESLVEQVVMVDGSLRFVDGGVAVGEDGVHIRYNRERLRITVVAPTVRRFTVNGSPRLSIADYDQPDLAIEINGSGDVTAAGETLIVTLSIAGSGDADLGDLQTRDASVSIAGSGDAKLSPKGAARVEIAGSGDVTLTTKPASLSSNIDGSGDLHLPD